LFFAFLEAGVAVELDVVMAGEVMEHAAGKRVLFCGAAAEKQQSNDTAYRHNYVGSSLHFRCCF
jgi:hypothetical protein